MRSDSFPEPFPEGASLLAARDRVYALTEERGGHLIWTGAAPGNVPTVRWRGRAASARRAVWELERGPLARGERMTSCRFERLCVAVDHLSVRRPPPWHADPFIVALDAASGRAGMTRHEAAARAGLQSQRVRSWIRDGMTPFDDELRALARVLGDPSLEDMIPTKPRGTEARALVWEGLRRKRMTLKAACRAAGVTPGQVQTWISGHRRAWRDDLERFAGTLEQPRLIELIPSRGWRLIKTLCENCGRTSEYKPGKVRHRVEKEGHFPGAQIDWEAGTARFPLCKSCTWRAVGEKKIARKKKKHGTKALIASAKHMNESRPADTLERAVQASADARRGRPLSPAHRDKMSRGLIHERRPGWVWGTCRVCRTHTFTRDHDHRRWKDTDLSQYRDASTPRWREVHPRCLSEYRSENRPESFPPPLRHRTPSPTMLAGSFELVVLYLRPSKERQLPIARAAEDGGHGLAARIHREPRTTRDRMQSFVRALPPDNRGGRNLTTIAQTLYRAASERWPSIEMP